MGGGGGGGGSGRRNGGGALAKSPVHESFSRAAGVTVQGTN